MSRPRAGSERGSALLVVLVMAAVIAIMLYRELPVLAFEARRTKEQVLVDRGHEYQRAVQLFYRKFRGQYPVSFDQLENTNNMRFLRRRYKDPFTGKDDWRLLHAGGPNGALIDSKVKVTNLNGQNQNGQTQNGPGQNGQNQNGQAQGSTNGFASFSNNSTSAFGATSPAGQSGNAAATAANSFPGAIAGGGFPGAATTTTGAEVEVPVVRKRAPAIASTGGPVPGQSPSTSELAQDPSIPLLPNSDNSESGTGTGVTPTGNTSSAAPGSGVAAFANSGVQAGGGGVVPPGANEAQGGSNAMQSVQSLFNRGPSFSQNQNGAGGFAGQGGTAVSTTGSTGQLNSGGLAGVASKAEGQTIKKVNDQTNYTLWEFWYDPSKDKSMSQGGSVQNGAGGQNVQNGTTLGQPGISSGFGNTGATAPTTNTSSDPNAFGGQQNTSGPNTVSPGPSGSSPFGSNSSPQ